MPWNYNGMIQMKKKNKEIVTEGAVNGFLFAHF